MGPVGIVSVMSQEVRNGFDSILSLIVLISMNLGIINLLPLPALDGGRLVFLLVEAVRRKPINPEYEGWVHAAGMLLLLGLIAVITYRDIVRLVTGA
jgi:regulator of sigma E protease